MTKYIIQNTDSTGTTYTFCRMGKRKGVISGQEALRAEWHRFATREEAQAAIPEITATAGTGNTYFVTAI